MKYRSKSYRISDHYLTVHITDKIRLKEIGKTWTQVTL